MATVIQHSKYRAADENKRGDGDELNDLGGSFCKKATKKGACDGSGEAGSHASWVSSNTSQGSRRGEMPSTWGENDQTDDGLNSSPGSDLEFPWA